MRATELTAEQIDAKASAWAVSETPGSVRFYCDDLHNFARALLAQASPAAEPAEKAPEPLREALDSREFHELCMDYRSAMVWDAINTPQACFERLQEFILRAALATPVLPSEPPVKECPPT